MLFFEAHAENDDYWGYFEIAMNDELLFHVKGIRRYTKSGHISWKFLNPYAETFTIRVANDYTCNHLMLKKAKKHKRKTLLDIYVLQYVELDPFGELAREEKFREEYCNGRKENN